MSKMKTTRKRRYAYFIGLCFALTGCSLIPPKVDDLQFKSVSLTNLTQEPGINWPQPSETQSRPFIPLLKIEFVSKRNLLKIAQYYEFNMTSHAIFCREKSTTSWPTMSVGDISYNNNYINPYAIKKVAVPDESKSTEYIYAMYVYVQHDLVNNWDGTIDSPKFDLRKETSDLCAAIHGGNMLGIYFDSNNFIIPASAISEALNESAK